MKFPAAVALGFMVFLLLIAPVFTADPAAQTRDEAQQPPSSRHWLGTDEFGRDLWARFWHGGRWSVGAGLGATVELLLLAWLAGSTAGFLGGTMDVIVMGLSELFLSVPWLYLLIGVRAALPLAWHPRTAVLTLLVLLAAVSWGRTARLVRGIVLSQREREYVHAARGLGVSEIRILTRHVLPATCPLLLTQILVWLPRFVMAELTLSLLGLGSSEPSASWGSLLMPLKQTYLIPQQWWRVLPVIMMVLFFLVLAVTARSEDWDLPAER